MIDNQRLFFITNIKSQEVVTQNRHTVIGFTPKQIAFLSIPLYTPFFYMFYTHKE